MQNTQTAKTLFDDLIPVSKWEERFAYPSTLSLRQLIFNTKNGFKEKVIVLIGKRMYVRISAFEKWIDEENSKQQTA